MRRRTALRAETDPLDLSATGARKRTVDGVVALEQATLELPEGIVLRYGYLYGPGTWYPNEKRAKPALHVDAAAQAALLAVSKGKHGIYNIAEDDGDIIAGALAIASPGEQQQRVRATLARADERFRAATVECEPPLAGAGADESVQPPDPQGAWWYRRAPAHPGATMRDDLTAAGVHAPVDTTKRHR